MVDKFWSEERLTPDEDKRFVLERTIELGIKEVLAGKEPVLIEAFGVILGTYLKIEAKLLDEADSLKTVWTIGRHLVNVYNW
jgi:hypothetical protein